MKIVDKYGGESMQKQEGFSLIELLIVVAIILIIAAIAIPNLLRARIAANESSAASSIRTVNTAEISYQSSYPTVGYASTMKQLGPVSNGVCASPAQATACLIDYALSNATAAATAKSGYVMSLSKGGSGDTNSYYVGAVPAVFNQTGVKVFCSIEDGVVRGTNAGNNTPIAVGSCPTTAVLN
jgi:type IV pilus assembly protein PilA